jgi:hypothetical protein
MTRNSKRTLAIGAALGAALYCGTLAASDTKSYPGAMCKPDGFSSTVDYGLDGSISHAASGTVTFLCPLLRDNVVTTSEPNEVRLVVAVADSTENLVCQWHAQEEDGDSIDSQAMFAPGGLPLLPGTRVLSAEPLDTAANGYYYIDCQIPPEGHAILSYAMEEQ